MKKQIFSIGFLFSLAVIVTVWMTAPDAFAQGKSQAQKEKEQKEKEQKENSSRGKNENKDQSTAGKNDKGKPDKDEKGRPDKDDKDLDLDDREKDGKKDKKVFGDIEKPNKAEKVTVCHKPGDAETVTITISRAALKAHLAHGDVEGACPAGTTRREDVDTDDENPGRIEVGKVREEVYTEIETTRSMTDYAEEVIRIAEERINVAKQRIETGTGAGTIEGDNLEDAKEIIREAESDLVKLKQEVEEARRDLREADSVVTEIFD